MTSTTMGPRRWTAEEEEALRAGVAKHGDPSHTNWRAILKDPEFGPKLHSRTIKMMKDKWRNMKKSESKRLSDAMQTASGETVLDSAAETTVAPCVAEAENKYLIAELEILEAEEKEIMKDLARALGMSEAETEARLIAEAENRDRLAELAVRKAEIISEMDEHAEAKLEFAKQLLELSETAPLLIAEAEDKDWLAAILAVLEAEDVSQMAEQLLEKCVLDENRDRKTSGS